MEPTRRRRSAPLATDGGIGVSSELRRQLNEGGGPNPRPIAEEHTFVVPPAVVPFFIHEDQLRGDVPTLQICGYNGEMLQHGTLDEVDNGVIVHLGPGFFDSPGDQFTYEVSFNNDCGPPVSSGVVTLIRWCRQPGKEIYSDREDSRYPQRWAR